MVDMIANGGILIYVLMLFSLISVTVIVMKLLEFHRRHISRRYIEFCSSLYWQEGFAPMIKLLKRDSSPLAPVLQEIGRVPSSEAGNQLFAEHIASEGAVMVEQTERHLHLLRLIGAVSPLVGLFGTVLGLSRTFFDVSAVSGAVDAGVLAGGIWEAMITTIAGLAVGIPAQISYHLFEERLEGWRFSAQMLTNHIMRDMIRFSRTERSQSLPKFSSQQVSQDHKQSPMKNQAYHHVSVSGEGGRI